MDHTATGPSDCAHGNTRGAEPPGRGAVLGGALPARLGGDGRFFAPDAHYTDVGVDGQGARGPQQIVDRLKIGIEPLSGYYHHPRHIVAEGDLVILEHVEEWQFHTGERIMHPFVTVMEVRDGKIVRWHDYSNIGNVIDHAPQWWLERIAQGYAAVGQ